MATDEKGELLGDQVGKINKWWPEARWLVDLGTHYCIDNK